MDLINKKRLRWGVIMVVEWWGNCAGRSVFVSYRLGIGW